MELAQLEHETEMMRLSGQQQISLADIQGRLQGIREKTQSDERKLSAEIAVDGRKPPGSPGSGGSV